MKKRFTFKCWNHNCERTYTLFKEITAEQELIIQCPYCNSEAVVRLEPFKKKTSTVIRGTEDDEQAVGYEYVFPDVIPTEEPK